MRAGLQETTTAVKPKRSLRPKRRVSSLGVSTLGASSPGATEQHPRGPEAQRMDPLMVRASVCSGWLRSQNPAGGGAE